MTGSVTSVFGEPEDFEAALRADGVVSLLVTGHGQFRARLTQITLHGLRLSSGDEYLPRIAFIAIPAHAVLVSLPIGGGPWPVWGGMEMQTREIITLGPGLGVFKGKTITESLPSIGGGGPRGTIFMLIIITILLIPFFAFREIGQVIGERELHSLIFTRKRSQFAGATASER